MKKEKTMDINRYTGTKVDTSKGKPNRQSKKAQGIISKSLKSTK